MTKTTNFLKILYILSLSESRCVPESRLKNMLQNPSKSKWHRALNELLQDNLEHPALLIETQNDDPEGERLFCLNSKGWQSFINAQKEGQFMLQCYQQVGYLLDSNFANMVFDLSDSETDKKYFDRLGQKFLHLAKVKAHKTKDSRRFIDLIIQALISEKKLELTYDDGVKRMVCPLTLCQHRDELYLMCDRQKADSLFEKRNYKIARIRDLKILEHGFKYPSKKEWDPSLQYEKTSGLILGEPKRVMVKIYGHSRKIIREKDFFNGEQTNTSSDHDTYVLTYTNPDEFLGQLFVYAQDIEIINDDELLKKFLNKAEEALQRNRKIKSA